MSQLNSLWVDICRGRDGLLLHEYHLPYHEVRGASKPEMIMFIGGKTKNSALRQFGFLPPGGSEHGKVHLRSISRHTNPSNPILIADCELHNKISFDEVMSGPPPPYLKQQSLNWTKTYTPDPNTAANLLYSRLFYNFSNTICLFANDLGGTGLTARILASWFYDRHCLDGPNPQILILKESDNLTENGSYNSFLGELSQAVRCHTKNDGPMTRSQLEIQTARRFGHLKVLALPTTSRSTLWSKIRSHIISVSNSAQNRREEDNLAFSADHLRAFYHLAFAHFAKDISSPFNFIRASREPNPVPQAFASHLTCFLKKVDVSDVMSFAVPVVASALTLDSYPPGMHYFQPIRVFGELYSKIFSNVNMKTYDENAISFLDFVNAVEHRFCHQVLQNSSEGRQTALTHRSTLLQFREKWQGLHSDVACFVCFARAGENTLTCQHSICDTCTIMYGEAEAYDPWVFKFSFCPLCSLPNTTTFRLKPYTAGVRCLSLDGGGVRGIIGCCFLKHLHEILALPLPIQDHFDIAVGTSSGGLVILGLYCNGWSIDECISQFCRLSHTAFRPRRVNSCLPLKGNLLSFLADSRYPSSGINTAVREAFGEKRLFACSGNGTKIAVTATKTKDSSTHILTNYNGYDQRPICYDYKLLRPENFSEELLVWHAARATSAAPLYFRSFRGYHDGALGGHNNPILLTKWEQDLIWSRTKKDPDIILSLGTGFKFNTEQDQEPLTITDRVLSILRGTSIPRLTRSYMLLLEAEKRHREYKNELKPASTSRYHRMTIEFHEAEPHLDDVKAIPDMVTHVQRFVETNQALLRRCANNMLASLFYITSNGLPVIGKIGVTFNLTIHCRLAPSAALLALLRQLQETHAYFSYDNYKSIACVDTQVYEDAKRGMAYSRHITLVVLSFEDYISIRLGDLFEREQQNISNCPYQASMLIQDQGLLCIFGHKDHKRRFHNAAEKTVKRVRK